MNNPVGSESAMRIIFEFAGGSKYVHETTSSDEGKLGEMGRDAWLDANGFRWRLSFMWAKILLSRGIRLGC